MTDETKGGFIVGFICAVLIIVGIYLLISLVVSIFGKCKDMRSKTITITPEDVDLIREAIAVSRINLEYEKYTVDEIIALQEQLTTIANQSSAIIEVSRL